MNTDAPFGLDPRYHTVDKEGNLRADFLFSYWIYAWFLLFYFTPDDSPKGTPSALIKKYLNPAFALYFALVENLATFAVMWVYVVQWDILLKFIAMICFVKLLPLYLLRNYPIRWERDLAILMGVFALYTVYLYWNETDLLEVYTRTVESVRQNKPYTPFFRLLDTISGVIRSVFESVSA